MGHKEAYAMLREQYNDKYWKQHSPRRAKLSKKEDIAFAREQKRILFEKERAFEREFIRG